MKNKKSNPNKLEKMRHSASHLMAMAVQDLYPGTKFGIGPAIENGFYYDFDLPEPISDKDLPKIERKMAEFAKQRIPFEKMSFPIEEAKKLFKEQPYKLELIEGLKKEGEKEVSVYRSGDFLDLCKGPHIKNTSETGVYKLMSVAGAYWRGSEKNPMLTRIYGVTFETKSDLNKYLKQQEEAKERDHRKLGKELDLFSQSDEVGPGLILWHPNLSAVREEIELYWRKEHRKRGYQYIYTPHIGRSELWKKSGHLDFFTELMYPPMKDERNDVYYIKPMNCPFHVQIYNSRPRSYRELPLRWGELGNVYRYELEGVRHGILRPRGFTQDDAHIICTEEQLVPEIEDVLDFALEMNAVFGFKNLHYELSLRDPKKKDKYIGKDGEWEVAEETLQKILDKRKIDYSVGVGEAKFYGPAIDLKAEDALGRLWQGTTIQFDFNLPSRFKMTYVGTDGKEHVPYMVHRTLLGSMERFVGVLIEQYSGAFPVWLAPMQVEVIPIAERHVKYAQDIVSRLRGEGIRVELDDRDDTMQAKIRNAQLQKVPYMLVIGDKEIEKSGNKGQETRDKDEFFVSVRLRTGKDMGRMSLEEFLKRINNRIETKSLEL